MNRNENERIDQIINLWISYNDKVERQDGIAGSGPTVAGSLVDFHGDLPESSNYKPETVSARAERMRQIIITHEEKYAREVLRRLPLRSRELVCVWPMVRNRHNTLTGDRWTMTNVADMLALTLEQFLEQREAACKTLLEFDKSARPGRAA